MKRTIIIHLICPDQKGIISQLTSVLHLADNNVLSIEQHVDEENNQFYIRLLVELPGATNNSFPKNQLLNLNRELKGSLSFFEPSKKMSVAILGTKEQEPIYDLLIKNKSGDLNCNIPIIISNHTDLKKIATQFNINFLKTNSDDEIITVLNKNKIDLIVLARYMQIIPDKIVRPYVNNIINIHHGFLPAFKGARPYHQAHKKGVKIIGATAHYVTNELDEGPIISQDVAPINHKHSIKDIIQLGREIERNVLYKAVKAHLEHKIVVYNNKTILFN